MPESGDVRAGDGVLPAGLLLIVRQVAQVAARPLDPPGDPAQAIGPVPGPGHQAGDLRDVLVALCPAVLRDPRLPRGGGDLADGVLVGGHDGPSAGEQDLLPRGGQGQQVADEVVAGVGPVDADQDAAPEPGRDLPQGRCQHLLVVGERVGAGVAGSQEHVQALAGVRAPGGERMEAVSHLPRRRGPFLVRAGRDEGASMSMTSHPVSVLPATASQGNPEGVRSMRLQACSLAFARAQAMRSSMRGVPARSRAADRGAARRGPQDRAQVREQGNVAHARGAERDRDGQRREHRSPAKQR
jgi:hypothetical protein